MLSVSSTAFRSEYSRDKPKMVRFVRFSYNVACDDDYHICRLWRRVESFKASLHYEFCIIVTKFSATFY